MAENKSQVSVERPAPTSADDYVPSRVAVQDLRAAALLPMAYFGCPQCRCRNVRIRSYTQPANRMKPAQVDMECLCGWAFNGSAEDACTWVQ